MRLAISAQCPYGAATDSMRMAALWTTSGLALVKRVKNFPARGCIGRPMRACPGQRYRPQCIAGYSQRGTPAPGGIPADQAEDTSCARRQQAIQPAASVAWQRHLPPPVWTPEGVQLRGLIRGEFSARAPWCTTLDTGERRCLLGLMPKMLGMRGRG
jgi:hypothetical protein